MDVPALPSGYLNKREKHKVYCRRNYYRVLKTIETLRKEVETLQTELDRLVYLASISCEAKYVQKYTRVKQLSEKLQQENLRLRELCDEKEHLRTKLSQIISDEIENRQETFKSIDIIPPSVQITSTSSARLGKKFSMSPSSVDEAYSMQTSLYGPDIPQLITPFQRKVCWTLGQQAYVQYVNFMASRDSYSTGACVLGWRDRVGEIEDSHVVYSFTKSFPQYTAREMSALAFQSASSPKHMEQMFSSPLVPKYYALHRADENNTVLYTELWNESMKLLKRGAYVASRFQVDEHEYMITYRTLDQTYFVDTNSIDKVHVPWGQYDTWMNFIDEGDHGCRASVSGKAHGNGNLLPKFWLLEMLLIVLRWESKMVGPIIKLTHDQS